MRKSGLLWWYAPCAVMALVAIAIPTDLPTGVRRYIILSSIRNWCIVLGIVWAVLAVIVRDLLANSRQSDGRGFDVVTRGDASERRSPK